MKKSTSVRLLSLVAALSCSVAFAGTVAPDLAATSDGQQVQVIVRYASGKTPTGLRGNMVRSLGTFGEVRTMSAAEAKATAASASVAGVSMDHPIQGTATTTIYPTLTCATKPACYDYTPETISPAGNTGGRTGSGVVVAVIDSGITTNTAHSDLAGRVIYSENFSTDQDLPLGADDLYGHGTQVAGIIAGNGFNSQQFIHGIAPGVSLVDLKVLSASGTATDSAVIAAINRAIELRQQHYNIQVINLSLGRPVFESYASDPLCQAVEQAWLSGITVVVAAGNQGRDYYLSGNQGYFTISAPGNDPLVITVGATNTIGQPNIADDIMTSYSSKGPTMFDHIAKPDLVAPGNQIFSVLDPGAALFSTPAAAVAPVAS